MWSCLWFLFHCVQWRYRNSINFSYQVQAHVWLHFSLNVPTKLNCIHKAHATYTGHCLTMTKPLKLQWYYNTMYLSWKSPRTLCERIKVTENQMPLRAVDCSIVSRCLPLFFLACAAWFKGARVYKSAWHALRCDKRVNSLTVISSRTRLLQLVCNHLWHYRWKLTPERFLNTITLTPSATSISDGHDSLPLLGLLLFFKYAPLGYFCPLKREIISICVTMVQHCLHMSFAFAVSMLPFDSHFWFIATKCQTLWQHERSLKSSLGTVLISPPPLAAIWHYQYSQEEHRQ